MPEASSCRESEYRAFFQSPANGQNMADLDRELGLFGATVSGVGFILGAGIYAILDEAAGMPGESVIVSLVLAAVIATITGRATPNSPLSTPRERVTTYTSG